MIRVLVVEDSPTVRMLLRTILDADPEIEVVSTATNGEEALRQAKAIKPDLITMDIRMPVMDGLEATRRIMEECPVPIVVVSASVDSPELQIAFNALQAGALDVVEKPSGIGHPDYERIRERLVTTVKLMSEVKVVTRQRRESAASRPVPSRWTDGRIDVAAMAASTGGPAALATILADLPDDLPVPILVVQHLTRGFDQGLVDWLNGATRLRVRLAVDGEPLRSGEVQVAPYDLHLGVVGNGRVALRRSAPVDGHRPSATYLFGSVAQAYGPRALGVVLTGMGDDGAQGLLDLKRVGGQTLAQDEATCVVYGMPREAVAVGAVDRVVALHEIAGAISALSRRGRLGSVG